jgi:glycosyltransferase involved in cell wall biosynthesis
VHRKPRVVPVTVIVPAYNEGASLADTLISLLTQTVAPAEILVVDDCSTDDTADVAARLGVRVLRPPANTGSKAGAQSFALGHVKTAVRHGNGRRYHTRPPGHRAIAAGIR